MNKKKFCYLIIIFLSLLLFIILFSILYFTNIIKNKTNTIEGNGAYWTVTLDSYDQTQHIYTLNYRYKGNISNLNNMKQISFAVGNEYLTQIVNVFDTSLQNQILIDDSSNQSKDIVFLNFNKQNLTNIKIDYDGFKYENKQNTLFESKTLIIIKWSYNTESVNEYEDTIRIN